MIHVVPKVKVTLYNNKIIEGHLVFYSTEHQLVKIDTLDVYIPFGTIQNLQFVLPEREDQVQFYYTKTPDPKDFSQADSSN